MVAVSSWTRCVTFVTAGGSLPVCAGCKQRIYDEQYLQALNTDWHTVCFRYVQRKLVFKGWRWSVSMLEWKDEWMSGLSVQ